MKLGTAEVLLKATTDQFNKDLKNSEKRVVEFGSQATASLSKVAVGFASLAGVGVSLGSIVTTTREFQKLEASLKTATGSAENAKRAFEALKEFATETPYSLQETTKAFTQLVNLGLTPSEQALRSYGNTSAALNKDITQMVEAVADAVTGEFERLKEFGIKASKQGDEVKFTFRGMTTTVKNSASEIEKYLIKLGEVNFGTAMSDRMKALDGALSNFGDSWEQLANNIGESGLGSAVETSVRTATDWISVLNEKFDTGEIENKIEKIGAAFTQLSSSIKTDIEIIKKLFDSKPGTSWFDTLLRGAAASQAGIAAITVQLAAQYDKMKAMSSGGNIEDVKKQYDIIDAFKKSQLADIDKTYNESIGKINQDVVFGKIPKQPGSTSDRLAGFKTGSDSGPQIDTKAQERAAKKAAKERERAERKALREAEKSARELESSYATAYNTIGVVNQTIYDQILSRYQKDKQDFIDATGDKLTAELVFIEEKKQLDKKYAEDSANASPEKKALKEKLDAYKKFYQQTGIMTQGAYDSFIAQYQKDKDEFIKATGDKAAAAKAYDELVRNMNQSVSDNIKKIETGSDDWTDSFKKGIDDFKQYSGSVGDLISHSVTDAFSGMEDSLVKFVATGKVEFSSLANSIIADLARIAIRKSITQPLADAAGSVNWGEMFAGIFHSGGNVSKSGASQAMPASWFMGAPRFHDGINLKNDEIPAILQTGERVLSRSQNKAYEKGFSGAALIQPVVNVTVNEAPGTKATIEQSAGPDGSLNLNVIIEQVESSIQGRMSRGTGMAPFLDSRYGRRY